MGILGDPVWNNLEITKYVELVTPFLIVYFGYFITRSLNKQSERYQERTNREELGRNDRLNDETLQRQTETNELERKHAKRIELRLDCQFLGIRNGQHLTTVLVLAVNRGQVQQKFKQITLRIRGIKDEPFCIRGLRKKGDIQWMDYATHFQHEVLKTSLLPRDWNFIFVEPGVSQQISFTTLIPIDYTFISLHVKFEYVKGWPHTAEAVFALPSK